MAFTKTNLRVLEDGTIGALATGKMWKYIVPSGDTITTAGYFKPETGMKATDIVFVVNSSSAYGFYIITESSGVLTATQMSEIS